MGFLLPMAIIGGVMTIFGIKRRKQSPLIDILTANEGIKPVSLVDRVVGLFKSSAQRSEAEIKTFTELKKVSVGLGLGVTGLAFFPLQLVGILYTAPTLLYLFKLGYHRLVHERRVNLDVLTTVLLSGALIGGLFFELLVGAWFVVLVRWLAFKTEDQSKQGIIDLFGQQMRSVWMLIDGVEVEVPVEKVQAGNVIVLHAGQMIPMDGIIVEGYASIDQHMLTGEAQPAEKGPSARVLAATVVLAGRICVQVEKAGNDTVAAQIGRALTETSDFRATLVSRAETFNDRMALPFLAMAGLTLPFIGLSSVLAILQATPGYRMVLYGPLSMLTYLHLAAQQGILIKDGRSIETLRTVDTVVFDKTGTLTLDQLQVSRVYAYQGFSEQMIMSYAAAAEMKQSHPIARAIQEAASAQGIVPTAIADAEYEVGYGITIKLNGKSIRVGSQRFIELHQIPIPPEMQCLHQEAYDMGHSLVLVAVDNTLAGTIVLEPTLRPEAHDIVSQLRAQGLRLYIISGDHEAPTQHLAGQLGIDGYFAEVLPKDKAALVKQLQDQGRKVCFVGDGINDSIALKSANVSVSLHGATTIAIDSAQIVLMNGNLSQLPQLFQLAAEFEANMKVNFYAATIPSIVIIGRALFFGWGLLTSMILYQVSVPFALYNTMRPLLTQKEQKVITEILTIASTQLALYNPLDKQGPEGITDTSNGYEKEMQP